MHEMSRKNARGIAILIVMVSLTLLMAVVADLSTKQTIKYKLAINERDALQAEALAKSGANFAKLILSVQEPLQVFMSNMAKMGIEMPAYTVWEIMPIDSDLLKGITDGSFMPAFEFNADDKKLEIDQKQKEDSISDEGMGKEVVLEGPYVAPQGGYGAFRGTFSTLIEDEEKKISIRGWPSLPFPQQKIKAEQIFRILSSAENAALFDGSTGDNRGIGASEIVGNIYDYISESDRSVDVSAPKESFGRDMIADKRSKYIDMPNISPKGAPMDSIAELRLIPGMTDAIYQVLSDAISIYAEGDSINILSAPDNVLAAAFYTCAKDPQTSPFQQFGFQERLLEEWNRKKREGELKLSPEGVVEFLQENSVEVDKKLCMKSIGTESKIFTVKSTATVGSATKTVLLRLRSAGGLVSLLQFQIS